MNNYSGLSQSLVLTGGSEVQLKFSDIETLFGGRLPPSARRHPAWWSNETRGTHKWAHLWLAAGWSCQGADFANETVLFHKVDLPIASVLEALKPQTKETIFDLLVPAKISTEAWFFTDTGDRVKRVKANPTYCYDWSFGSIQEKFALCIWQGTLSIDSGRIVFQENLRELSQRLFDDSRRSINDTKRKRRSAKQAVRAKTFDDALNVSYARGLPVSVILTEGDRRSREELGEGSSHVQFRTLDAVKWYVHQYDEATGAALLVRGILPAGVTVTLDSKDDAARGEDDVDGPPDDVQMRAVKIRRGQGMFRESLLAAYQRKCAITGCRVVDLLEAAHITPHASGPNYRVSNGLLLRSDIHTLFDLNLIGIDAQRDVRLAPMMAQSEYLYLEGKKVNQPMSPGEMPSGDALAKRYAEFRSQHPIKPANQN